MRSNLIAADSRLKENEEILKRMNRSMEKKIFAKEQEIENINSNYDKRVEQTKSQGEEDLIQSIDRNNQRIINASKDYEDRMGHYKNQLSLAQKKLSDEELAIKTTQRDRLDAMKVELENNFSDQYMNALENQRDINQETQNSVKEIALKSKSEKQNIENKSQYEISALSSDFNRKVASSEKNYKEQLENDVRMHTADLNRQREELKKIMMTDTEKNKRVQEEKTRVQKDQLTFLDQHQDSMIKQRNDDFKVRYDQMVKEHNEILKGLEKALAEDVHKLALKNAADKKRVTEKQDDSFYHIDKLNPKIKVLEGELEVALPVPEYEKENVHLSAQGRNIKITLSRKFSDDLTDTDGSINRSNRSELYSKEFSTDEILNPKSIVQKYQDGVLTYRIKNL